MVAVSQEVSNALLRAALRDGLMETGLHRASSAALSLPLRDYLTQILRRRSSLQPVENVLRVHLALCHLLQDRHHVRIHRTVRRLLRTIGRFGCRCGPSSDVRMLEQLRYAWPRFVVAIEARLHRFQ